MKKIIFAICMFCTLVLTSYSDLNAQSLCVGYDGIVFEYSYHNVPVMVVDGTYHWYTHYNNSYCWKPMPREYWREVRHHERPKHFRPEPSCSNNRHYKPYKDPQGHFPSSTRVTEHKHQQMPPQGNSGPNRGHIVGKR